MLFTMIFSLLDLFLVELSPLIFRHPNIAQLHERPEHSPLKFIDKVIHFVWAFNEPRFIWFNPQLHLDNDFVPVHDVDQNILGDIRQPIPDCHNFEQVRLMAIDFQQFVIKANYLFFFWVAPSSQQISNIKTDQLNARQMLPFFNSRQ